MFCDTEESCFRNQSCSVGEAALDIRALIDRYLLGIVLEPAGTLLRHPPPLSTFTAYLRPQLQRRGHPRQSALCGMLTCPSDEVRASVRRWLCRASQTLGGLTPFSRSDISPGILQGCYQHQGYYQPLDTQSVSFTQFTSKNSEAQCPRRRHSHECK